VHAVAAKRRKGKPRKLNRRLAVAAVLLMGFLYWKPIHAYLHTRSEVAQRQSEVRALAAQKRALLQRLSFSTSTNALAHEARRLGFVRPGERLYIVKGIPKWRQQHRATIGRDG
jgi:cell division protein FtsB